MTTTSPLAIDRLVDRQVPSQPRVSPDGESIAFTVKYVSKQEDRARSQVWIARGDEPPFSFTSGTSGASEPDWSPDGKSLVFLSGRDDKEDRNGIFTIRVDGGEAAQVGKLRGEISQPRWAPDERHIAFVMADPETEAEKKDKEAKRDQIVIEEDPKHLRLYVVDVETGKHRCLTTGHRSVRDYSWSPDSEYLVAITTKLPDANTLFTSSRLAAVPAAGGIEREISRFPMAPAHPVVREVDGSQTVAVIANDHRTDPTSSIWIVDWDGRHKRNTMPELRGTVYDIIPDPESPDQVLALIVEGTHGRIYRVSLNTGKRELLSPGTMRDHGTIDPGISTSRDGSRLAFVWSSSDTPEDLWALRDGGNLRKLTEFGSGFEDELAPGEVVRWSSFDGVEIEGVLLRPRGAAGPTPLFVEVHGGPTWQWEDRAMLDWHDWAQMLVSRGWSVLLPNPRGSTGYGSGLEKLLQDDVGFGESKDLVAGADAMVERGIADPQHLAIGGWSWGGFLTARTITQTQMFKAAIMGAGVANLTSDHGAGDIPIVNEMYYPGHPYDEQTWEYYAKGTPIREASKVTTPTLILHGDSDDRVHPTQGQEYFRALQQAGVPVQFVRYPREGHSILEREHQLDLMQRIVDWLARWVPQATHDPAS